MIEFKRILFPTDFSGQSAAVAPFVHAMAKRFDSEVISLHVGGRSQITWKFPAEYVIIPEAPGGAGERILEYAEQRAVDLIMLATHGHSPFRALILGSVTTKLLHGAKCPVWTGVHAEGMISHSPDRWKRMACAIDTDERDVHVIQWASEFARAQNLELRLIHAVAGAGGMWTQESDPSMYDFLFHAARERLATLQTLAGTNIEPMLVGGSVGRAVHQAAGAFDADLMIVGRGAGSNAYAIVREAPCPVISV
jgi:nucleotide-binding universal stress UspA family protein